MKIKKLEFMNCNVFFLVIIMITVVFKSVVLAYNLEEYYPLGKWDSWTYVATATNDDEVSNNKETIVLKIRDKEIINGIEVSSMIYVSEDDKENGEYVTIDSEGIKQYKSFSTNEYEIFDPPMMLFPNNLDLENRKEYKFNVEHVKHKINSIEDVENRETYAGSTEVVFDSVEDVEVPAGRFTECLKFSRRYSWQKVTSRGEDSYTFWLAPYVGQVKVVQSSTVYKGDDIKEKNNIIIELVSASIDGEIIESQESPVIETPPQAEEIID